MSNAFANTSSVSAARRRGSSILLDVSAAPQNCKSFSAIERGVSHGPMITDGRLGPCPTTGSRCFRVTPRALANAVVDAQQRPAHRLFHSEPRHVIPASSSVHSPPSRADCRAKRNPTDSKSPPRRTGRHWSQTRRDRDVLNLALRNMFCPIVEANCMGSVWTCFCVEARKLFGAFAFHGTTTDASQPTGAPRVTPEGR